MGTPAAACTPSRSLAGNRALERVLAGYALFVLTEYSAWIAVLVFAYSHGGATVAGVVAVAQLVPGAILAPVMAAVADRRSPVVLLAGGYLAQATGMAAAAAAIFTGVPVAVYVSAVIACVAQTTVRPAQSALVPLVAATADQLTAVNVVVSWLESAGMLTSGLLAGVLISLAGVGSVFVVCAGLGVVAMLLAAGLHVTLAPSREGSPAVLTDVAEGLRLTARQPRLRVMLALLTAESVVAGALDLLFVILAVSVLGRSEAWAGYLNSAYGIGAVLAATVGATLIGRRLGAPILGAAVLVSAALAALALGTDLAGTVALLAVAGAACTLLDVALRTLLQRSVPLELMGRVFGVLEGLTMAGYALGALLVPLLVPAPGRKPARADRGGRRAAAGRHGKRSHFVRPGLRYPCACRGDRATALAAVVRRTSRARYRGPGGGPDPSPRSGWHRPDPAGRSGRCLLCDRGGRARRPARWPLPAAMRPRRRSPGRSPSCAPSPARPA